jgi:hypothetical protein
MLISRLGMDFSASSILNVRRTIHTSQWKFVKKSHEHTFARIDQHLCNAPSIRVLLRQRPAWQGLDHHLQEEEASSSASRAPTGLVARSSTGNALKLYYSCLLFRCILHIVDGLLQKPAPDLCTSLEHTFASDAGQHAAITDDTGTSLAQEALGKLFLPYNWERIGQAGGLTSSSALACESTGSS